MYQDVLNSTSHRAYPLPDKPWLMTQKWNDLLFIHLPVSNHILEAQIPEGIELDTFEGTGWITIIPFEINNMHLRKMPPIPFLHSFLELNVRTYVKRNGVPGIYFFSLDANNLPAVLGARIASLPYYYAEMDMVKKTDTIDYVSARKDNSEVIFEGCYKPISEAYYPEQNSLSYWLLERYYLWSYRNKSLFRGDIHHKPWRIQDAKVTIKKQSMLPNIAENAIIGESFFHYADVKRVLFWPIQKVE